MGIRDSVSTGCDVSPAVWSETAKQTMRRAAVMAGLVSHPGSKYMHASVCYMLLVEGRQSGWHCTELLFEVAMQSA